MIHFFLAGNPPTMTQQEHRIGRRRDGSFYIYEDRELKEARMQIRSRLARVAPDHPAAGPLRLVVKWMFPNGSHRHGTYKDTKPDTDNLNKMLKDEMTKAGFWRDDAQVASEIIEKFWSEEPGIYIEVWELEEDDANNR